MVFDMRRFVVGFLGVSGVALVAASGAHAQAPNGTVHRPVRVSTYADTVVTSVFDQATNSYRLAVRSGTGLTPLPVAPRSVPFDVDVGPGEDGRPVAVYSRCAQEPVQPSPTTALPEWPTGLGCDVVRFDFATGRESKLEGASTDESSEYLPSMWEDEVAFARTYADRDGRRGRLPYLYVRPLDGGESDRQPGGARGTDGFENGPRAVDLYGRRLAFVWARYRPRDFEFEEDYRFFEDEVRLDTVGGGHERLDVISGDTVNKSVDVVSVQVHNGRVFYAQECFGDCSERFSRKLRSYRISNEDRAVADLPATGQPVSDVYVSAAQASLGLFAVRGPYDDPTGTWRLDLIETPEFRSDDD